MNVNLYNYINNLTQCLQLIYHFNNLDLNCFINSSIRSFSSFISIFVISNDFIYNIAIKNKINLKLFKRQLF